MPTTPPRAPRAPIDALADIAGLEVRPREVLARHSTFRIGGPAEWFALVKTAAALGRLLAVVRELDVPFLILGLGSNILFPDDGLPGVVARLGGDFGRLEIAGTRVTAGAALSLPQVARNLAARGLVGLEALAGFPSTVGGAVYMNAGCYGTEIRDVLASAALVDPDGRQRRVTADELEPGYRETNLRDTGTIVVEAVFELRRGDAAAALARIDELNRKRWQSLPAGVANAGSIFRNPPGDYAGRLVDACGLKGTARGAARISARHGNVIVNEGGARAGDVLALMLEMRRAVRERFAVELVPEVVLAGELGHRWRAAA
ncbi:MAG: UDP-N-acetylmuramate dehydrogenase [Acidobacteriota bacterium]|nr:UDP-N-acetylmuramate dehydrogenase [Acidobacteriota bacterium]